MLIMRSTSILPRDVLTCGTQPSFRGYYIIVFQDDHVGM